MNKTNWKFIDPDPKGDGDEITVEGSASGLSWTGFAFNPAWGGAYTIGFQSLSELIDKGPLKPTTPPAIAAEMKAWAETAAAAKDSAQLVIRLVARADEVTGVFVELDGHWLAQHAKARPPCELFRGPIAAGKHALGVTLAVPRKEGTARVSRDKAFTAKQRGVLEWVIRLEAGEVTIARA